MDASEDLRRILSSYLRRNAQAQVTYSNFLGFLERYLQQNELDNPNLVELRQDTHQVLSSILRKLERTGTVQLLRSETTPLTLVYPVFYTEEVERAYQRAGTDMEELLPSEESLSIAIPGDLIQVIDVKTEFVTWLANEVRRDDSEESSVDESEEALPGKESSGNQSPSNKKPVLRLAFPNGLPSLVAVPASLAYPLILASVQKLRQYLHAQKNMTYVKQKLLPVFRGREIPLRDMLQQVLTSPELCAKGILNANDFLFQFWTHLSTNVIKEFADKLDKLPEEQNYCQAAYLLGYYSVFCKGREQRKKDEESSLKQFALSLKKPPYAFSIQDIYQFKDDKGLLLLQRSSKEQLHRFLAEQMKSPDGKALPTIMRLILPEGKEYYLAYDSIPLIIAQQLPMVQRSFKDYYVSSWQIAMLSGKRLATIDSREAFASHVESRFREIHPLLYSILKYETLFLISQESSTRPALRQALLSLIQAKEQKLKPYPEILALDHGKLVADVKILLPFWMVVPGIKQIAHFFRKLFLGKSHTENLRAGIDFEGQEKVDVVEVRKEEKPAAREHAGRRIGSEDQEGPKGKSLDLASEPPSSGSHSQNIKAQQAAFREKVKKIADSLLEKGMNLDQALKQEIEQWNPLLEATAKKNLVEDVNSMCRDFLRGLKLSYRKPPPGPESLNEMSKRLAAHPTFDRIRNREALQHYIKLYFLKILSK